MRRCSRLASRSTMGSGSTTTWRMQTQEDALVPHGIRLVCEKRHGRRAVIRVHRRDGRCLQGRSAPPRFFTHTSGGAVSRVDELATAFPHRNAETMLVFTGFWTDPRAGRGGHCRRSGSGTRSSSRSRAATTTTSTSTTTTRAVGNYGPAYERLSRIKGAYDPGKPVPTQQQCETGSLNQLDKFAAGRAWYSRLD